MKTLLAVTVFSMVLASTYALKCYVCEDTDSAVIENPECGDTFEKSEHDDLLKTCNATAGEVWCRKNKAGVNNIATKITRSCTAQCEDDKGAYLNRVDCCQDDGCNGSNFLKPTVFAILATTLFSVLKFSA